MKRFGVAATLALMVFAGAGLVSAQGLYFETTRSGQGTPSTKVWYMPGMAKIVTNSGNVIVIRNDKQMVDILNPGKKTYSEISYDDLQNKQFANLTPDQRKVLEEHMGQAKDKENAKPNIAVEKASDTKTIEGFKCKKYVVKKDGQPSGTIWATSDIKLADDFHKDAKKLFDRLGSAMGAKDQFSEWVDKVDGFPIQIERQNSTTKITHIKQEPIPESAFSIPPGYAKASEMHQGGKQPAGQSNK
jgi:hypothetical protein